MNRADPLDDLGSGDAVSAEIPPAPEDYESEYPLVSERSKRDIQEFGLNMVDDYQDFEHELLSWLANYGKGPEKHEGRACSNPRTTNSKLPSGGCGGTEQYTTQFTPDHADKFVRILDQSDGMIDSTVLHHAKDIKRYFRFSNHVRGTLAIQR